MLSIVRGRRAEKRKEVKLYRAHIVLNTILSVLGGLGIAQVRPNAELFSGSTLLFLGGIILTIIAVALELYKVGKIEQTAINALAAKDAFDLVEAKLGEAIQQDDNPTEQINSVFKESWTLIRNFLRYLPPEGPDMRHEGQQLSAHLLQSKGDWDLTKQPADEKVAE